MLEAIDERALTQLQELIGGDRNDLCELIETFLVEGQEIIIDMQSAVAENNIELLNRSAHSMKSSAQDFGAATLSSQCAALESACKNGFPENASGQVSDISKQFTDAHNELKSYISQ